MICITQLTKYFISDQYLGFKIMHKGYILYDSNYVALWKKQDYRDRISDKISGYQGLGVRKEIDCKWAW